MRSHHSGIKAERKKNLQRRRRGKLRRGKPRGQKKTIWAKKNPYMATPQMGKPANGPTDSASFGVASSRLKKSANHLVEMYGILGY